MPHPVHPSKSLAAILLGLCLALTAHANPGTDASPATEPSPHVLENTLGMRFVRVPAGSFQMGGDETPEQWAQDFPRYERDRFLKLGDEAPVHTVRITRPFYLGQHEVTVGQFRAFVQASGYTPESVADGTGGYGYNPDYDPSKTVRGDAFEGRDPRYSWEHPGFPQTERSPVVNVTWNDAVAMARWLSQTEGRTYRLPTEAEWEYACRAGSRTPYFHGRDPAGLTAVANVFDAAAAPHWPRWQAYALPGNDGHAFTAPVGSYPPNAFGLHDMLGNAWEWVSDWHADDTYARSPAEDPPGPAEGQVKVRRGGSWHTWAFYARCGFRNWNTPQTRYTLVGMRLLLEADPAENRR